MVAIGYNLVFLLIPNRDFSMQPLSCLWLGVQGTTPVNPPMLGSWAALFNRW